MYAKLVVGASANLYQCIRDMCRLLTDESPSISDLSGQGFNTSTSAIIDATPAGWTYVGSSKATDQGAIGSGAADATFSTTTYFNWAVSAPMAGNPSALKYVIFNQSTLANSTPGNQMLSMSGATSVTSDGVATNEGYRVYNSTAATITQNSCHILPAGAVFHLIANPRHITLIREGRGMSAAWEMTTGEVNTFYNKPLSFCTLSHPVSSQTGYSAAAAPVLAGAVQPIGASVFDIVDPNTGTEYGAYSPLNNLANAHFFVQLTQGARVNTYDASGNPRYQVTPIMVNCTNVGQPLQYVSGVVPVYWCKAGLGATGDTVNVAGVDYTFFNCGAAGTAFGLLMQTS